MDTRVARPTRREEREWRHKSELERRTCQMEKNKSNLSLQKTGKIRYIEYRGEKNSEGGSMNRPCVHLICTAHLDPVWQWQWEEGCAEAIATFRNAAQLLREHKSLIFNHNEALLYRWVKKMVPDLFKEIQKLAQEGRWVISGGWYLQPDLNLPGTESLIRHITEGLHFFGNHFRARPRVAYNFDSFGHSGGLPQILRLAGYEMYIHMRPQTHELELPSDLYRWQGVDGTEILAYRMAVGLYHTEYDNIEQRLREGVELAIRLKRDVPVFWGVGNHGGGATREDLQKIDAFIRKEDRVDIVHSSPEAFCEAVNAYSKNLPLVKGDLQRVFTGCYTSLSRLKRQAQKSLHSLVQAESLSAFLWWVVNRGYPEKELEEAWRYHLFNDFHDIITGTCIEPAEKDALHHYGTAFDKIRHVNLEAAAAVNDRAIEKHPGLKEFIPVTLLNADPGLKKAPVEVECMISHRPKWQGTWHLRLSDLDGRAIPCNEEQPEALLPFNEWRRKVVFMVDLQGCGARHYSIRPVEGVPDKKGKKSAVRFAFGPLGLIDKWFIDGDHQILDGPLLQPIVVADEKDSWGTDCWSYRKILGRFRPEKDNLKIIENGPVRTICESHLSYKHSRIVMRTLSYSDWPVLEFRLRVLWNEKLKRLKLAIPTAFKSGNLGCEIPGGIIARPADGQEHVHGRWFMLGGQQDKKRSAFGIAHIGLHGLDFKNGEVRLSVLRSAAYCHEKGFKLSRFPSSKFMDQGVHEIRLLAIAGNAKWVKTQLPCLADWLCAPPVVYAHLPVGGFKIKSEKVQVSKDVTDMSKLLRLSPENVRLLACKRSKDGKALIIRIQECGGISSRANLRLSHPKILAEFKLKPLEIKTLRIEKNGLHQEVDLIKEKSFSDRMT
jgi:alpha-mannosidase